jgi:hypothetical protein
MQSPPPIVHAMMARAGILGTPSQQRADTTMRVAKWEPPPARPARPAPRTFAPPRQPASPRWMLVAIATLVALLAAVRPIDPSKQARAFDRGHELTTEAQALLQALR